MTWQRCCAARALLASALALSGAGCEKAMQDMYDQPRYEPFQASTLFANGASARVPVAGTRAARAGALADSSGGRGGALTAQAPLTTEVMPVFAAQAEAAPASRYELAGPHDIPLTLDRAAFRRGQERYDIFCTPCHGLLGDGDGMVVRRGFPAPPSYHSERLRRAPDAHFHAVISHGYGVMYSYADRLDEQDRWSVVAYIRALQLSQHAPLQSLAAGDRQRLGAAEAGDD